ncbi:6-cysteine protein [Plasmodium ovale wallikeri]|uniref:6-cysteine protein, putative n=2 Tax=Plasmodium ovale TaxID=36330 RepID=A0A1C3KNQ7_PLAOA|nr:6-cysteine protein [Plasmodium ovale wallikeri]SBT75700.1 6-cysteine protein, putative [Plasmodium ovale]
MGNWTRAKQLLALAFFLYACAARHGVVSDRHSRIAPKGAFSVSLWRKGNISGQEGISGREGISEREGISGRGGISGREGISGQGSMWGYILNELGTSHGFMAGNRQTGLKEYSLWGINPQKRERLLQEDDNDDDVIDEGYETTLVGETGIQNEDIETFFSNNTNNDYVCDFTEHVKPGDETVKVKKCEIKVKVPLVKVKIVCPLKGPTEKLYDNIEYYPKKSPYVVLEGTTSLKEKKLSEIIYGVIIPKTANDKNNNLDQGIIEFILPPMVEKKSTFYIVCDNSKTKDEEKKGNRGVVEVSIEPYGNIVKGCNYEKNNDKNAFFEKNIYLKKKPYIPCFFHLNGGETGGIMFPSDLKETTCFEEIILHNNNAVWDKKKKSLTEIINSSVIYNKEMNEKYFNVKYISIPLSFKDSLSFFCTITTENEKKHLVYVSINQEINMSIFELFESFLKINKVSQIAQKTEGKDEYTCNFVDSLDKNIDAEKKVIICRKTLKELDVLNVKCNVNAEKYKNMNIIPKTLKEKHNVLMLDLHLQYYLMKKYLQFNTKKALYYHEQPFLLTFPFNKIAKIELKKNPMFKKHKSSKYFSEHSPSDGLVHLLSYIDSLENVYINNKVPYMNVHIDESDSNVFNMSFQVPPYVSTNHPFYFLIGCDNTKDGGNIGIVEVLISKNEEYVKGCNFHDTKINYFTNNVETSTNNCQVDVYPNDIVGFNCYNTASASTESEEEVEEEEEQQNVVLDPEDCFKTVYDGSSKKKVTDILPTAYVYNLVGKKTPSFIKIPSYTLTEDKMVTCKCTLKSETKIMKINIKKNNENKNSVDIKKEAITGDDIKICTNKDVIHPRWPKWEHEMENNFCKVDVTNFFSYVEILCPAKDLSSYSNIELMFNTESPNKDELKEFTEKELHKLIPHAEILYKTEVKSVVRGRTTLENSEEKDNLIHVDLSHLYLFFPYYVKEEHQFNVICDNTETRYDNKRGNKLVYTIKVPKREHKVKGCDFSIKKSDMFENEVTGDSTNTCTVNAQPKDVIAFLCPPGSVKITNCFHDAVVNDTLTNIHQDLNLQSNIANYTYNHKVSYIEIPSVIKNDLSFKCICVDLKKDYNLTIPPSTKNLDIIYKKLNIKKNGYTKGIGKEKYHMRTIPLHLSNQKNQIVDFFEEVENRKAADADANPQEIIDAVVSNDAFYEYSTGEHISGEEEERTDMIKNEYYVWENIYNNNVEDTIEKDIEALEKTDFKIYTLEVNLKAPKLVKSKQVADGIHLCDFSSRKLLIPDPQTEGVATDIHCYVSLKPLDTFYVKCPTVKGEYETAKGKTSEEDDEYSKEIIALIDEVALDEASSDPLDEQSFVKYFDKMELKPSDFFKNVINEKSTEEETIDKLLPGVIFSQMTVLKKKNPFTSYAAVIIPPGVTNDVAFNVQCNNNAYVDTGKTAGYNAIVHLDIPKNEKKITGCDFSTSDSTILSEGIELVEGQTKECNVELNPKEEFGLICNTGSTLDPEKCFYEVYDTENEVKKIKELIPNVKVVSLQNKNQMIVYGVIPEDYIYKLSFSCSCKKSGDTKGTMKVILNKDEVEYDKLKIEEAVKHDNVNLCNFYDGEELSFENNTEKVILCKVDAALFSEVIIQLPVFGVENDKEMYKKFSLSPVWVKGEDIKVITAAKVEETISSALKGVFGNRTFTFTKKEGKGEGLSFFIPPVTTDINLKIKIKEEKEISSESTQRGLIHICIKKNVEKDGIKFCDFTTGQNSLIEHNPVHNENTCNIKIKSGDIFGIMCPKGFSLFPQGCFSKVILEYYKGVTENNDDINYLNSTMYNLKPNEIKELLDEDHRELEDLQNFSTFSNITEMLNFENYNLGNLSLDYKRNNSAAYAKVPDTFSSIINFSCSCYDPQKNIFGTMNVQSENRNFVHISSNQEEIVKGNILPRVGKLNELMQREEVVTNVVTNDEEDLDDVGDITMEIILEQARYHLCDYSDESLFTLIGGKPQKNICKINAKGLDVITVKCPHTKGFVPKKVEIPPNLEENKIVIAIDGKEYSTYFDKKKKDIFSLRDIYIMDSHGITLDELKQLRKVQHDWDDYHIFYPKNILEDVVINNSVVKLKNYLPGVIFLQNKINEEIKTTQLPTDGIVSFVIPPYVNKDFTLQIYCGKSTSKKPKKVDTSLGLIHINISANKNTLSGCDFVNPEKSPNSLFNHKKDKLNALMCEISLVPNSVVGINCPKKMLKPEKCFYEMYYVDETDMVNKFKEAEKFSDATKVNVTEIVKHSVPIGNVEDVQNTYSYLILPKNMDYLTDSKKLFVCTCDKNIVKMKIDSNSVKEEKIQKGEKELCTYDNVKKVSTCNIIDAMEINGDKNNSFTVYTAHLSRWDKLIIKYPTSEKTNYENSFVKPLNIKEKVLYKNVPTNIEDILPGSITTNTLDSRTKISEYTLRVPPYVPKNVDFSLEFNNNLTQVIHNDHNPVHGNTVKIAIYVNEGHKEINGCDFTGKYNHLFTNSFKPIADENKECTVTFGNNSFAGFACSSNFHISPENCFASIFDNNDDKKVKKIHELSTAAEHDYIKHNTSGYTLSYITFHNDTKKQNISCKCISSHSSYTINLIFEPLIENSVHTIRALIRYVDLKKGNFAKYLRRG